MYQLIQNFIKNTVNVLIFKLHTNGFFSIQIRLLTNVWVVRYTGKINVNTIIP